MPTEDQVSRPSVLIVRNTGGEDAPVLVVVHLAPDGTETIIHRHSYDQIVEGYRALEPALRAEYETGVRDLVVDLGNVPWIDSTGIGTLVAVTQAFRDGGGAVALANARPRVAGVFRLTGLEALFRLFHSTEDAVQWLREGGD